MVECHYTVPPFHHDAAAPTYEDEVAIFERCHGRFYAVKADITIGCRHSSCFCGGLVEVERRVTVLSTE